MHANPNRPSGVPAGSVTGLGICDALRIELRAVQVPWLMDELDETWIALKEERRRSAATTASTGSSDDEDELNALEYRLYLLQLIRRQLRANPAEPIAVVGPGDMMSDLVRGTTLHVIETLAELAHVRSIRDADSEERLADAAEAAAAWVQTVRDCDAVELSNFDSDADPPSNR